MENKRITWVEISQSALKHNIRQFTRIIKPPTELLAVVKSNAYGHGIVEAARIIKRAGVNWLATVNLDEALLLRKNGIAGRILVLSYFHPDKLADALKHNITLTVYSLHAAQQLDTIGRRIKKNAIVHFKVDTGTSRLGLRPEQSLKQIQKISTLKNVRLEGVFSHFADAENPTQRVTMRQIKKFSSLLESLSASGIDIPLRHIACSAATILNKASHFDLVRIGISLYGLWSVEKDGLPVQILHKNFSLKPVLSWKTRIIQIKEIERGSAIGYGCTYTAKKKLTIAVLPVGYWEGYDRKLSNTGAVLIRGMRCPIRGRICMNLTMVDVSHLKSVRTGDSATLIGKDGPQTITADELAEKVGTINYEIVTRINPLIPRIITD
ncbi:MAG: alanine racemase [Patescibacteria group bacterium]